ncbi:unnamed protein product [Prorocentrum cordatum]|uniref:Uncharacterized protein n=1 Tax=Prorocentrum cordatum TaxID=2364126 RepID=A0ABN9QKA7_9DINO|nr:unnamed protein product [Polarella glacialis]
MSWRAAAPWRSGEAREHQDFAAAVVRAALQGAVQAAGGPSRSSRRLAGIPAKARLLQVRDGGHEVDALNGGKCFTIGDSTEPETMSSPRDELFYWHDGEYEMEFQHDEVKHLADMLPFPQLRVETACQSAAQEEKVWEAPFRENGCCYMREQQTEAARRLCTDTVIGVVGLQTEVGGPMTAVVEEKGSAVGPQAVVGCPQMAAKEKESARDAATREMVLASLHEILGLVNSCEMEDNGPAVGSGDADGNGTIDLERKLTDEEVAEMIRLAVGEIEDVSDVLGAYTSFGHALDEKLLMALGLRASQVMSEMDPQGVVGLLSAHAAAKQRPGKALLGALQSRVSEVADVMSGKDRRGKGRERVPAARRAARAGPARRADVQARQGGHQRDGRTGRGDHVPGLHGLVGASWRGRRSEEHQHHREGDGRPAKEKHDDNPGRRLRGALVGDDDLGALLGDDDLGALLGDDDDHDARGVLDSDDDFHGPPGGGHDVGLLRRLQGAWRGRGHGRPAPVVGAARRAAGRQAQGQSAAPGSPWPSRRTQQQQLGIDEAGKVVNQARFDKAMEELDTPVTAAKVNTSVPATAGSLLTGAASPFAAVGNATAAALPSAMQANTSGPATVGSLLPGAASPFAAVGNATATALPSAMQGSYPGAGAAFGGAAAGGRPTAQSPPIATNPEMPAAVQQAEEALHKIAPALGGAGANGTNATGLLALRSLAPSLLRTGLPEVRAAPDLLLLHAAARPAARTQAPPQARPPFG